MDGVTKFLLCISFLSLIIILPLSLNAQVYVCHDSVICVAYDTMDAHFGIGHADGRRLTYAYSPPEEPWEPGVSETHFVLRVNDDYFTNFPWYVSSCGGSNINDYPMTQTINYDPLQVTTTWEIERGPDIDITFQQILTPTTFRDLPQVRIEYTATNEDDFSANVGIIIVIDVKINNQDSPPMEVGWSIVDTGSIWNTLIFHTTTGGMK